MFSASRLLPWIPALTSSMIACDLEIVKWDKSFTPQAAFGSGCFIIATETKLEQYTLYKDLYV